MKIAVIGSGISGLGSAYLLSKKYEVDLYEKENRLGGHARTTIIRDGVSSFGVDTGFLVFNNQTYPLLTKLFKQLNIEIENSNMGFSFWDENSNVAYNGESLSGMFLQKKNLFNLKHYRMIFDILKFNKNANKELEQNDKRLDLTLGEYLQSYSEVFKTRYIIPMGAAIWSTPSDKMDLFPARVFLQFFKNHGLLGVNTHYQWLTVGGGSINYVKKIAKEISGEIFLNSKIEKVYREENKIILVDQKAQKKYDKVVFATHAPDTLNLLSDATPLEKEILEVFKYKKNDALLHTDKSVLYKDEKSFAAWNYKTTQNTNGVTLSYWINKLQNLPTKINHFVSLNETKQLKNVIEKITYEHPQFDHKTMEHQKRLKEINGVNNTYFAGAYWRYGFHEDGLWSANNIAKEFGCEL